MIGYRLELAFLLLLVVLVWCWYTSSLPLGLVSGSCVLVTGSVLLVRWGRVVLHQAIWKLRNRLIVAYIFIAVIPTLLIAGLLRQGSQFLGGQVGVHLVYSELERRVNSLQGAARTLARTPPERRSAMLDRMEALFQERFPGL